MGPRHRASGFSGEKLKPRRRLGFRTIRSRLAVILAIPTTLLVVLAAVGVAAQAAATADASSTLRTVDLVLSTQELIHQLQRERGLTSGILGGDTAFRSQIDEQRKAGDAARTVLNAKLAGSNSTTVSTAVGTALRRLGDLGEVRASVDAGRLSRADAITYYTSAIGALNEASSTGPNTDPDDAVLRQGLESLRLLGNAKEATGLERATLNGVFSAGAFSQADYVSFTEVRASKLDALAEFALVASPARRSDLETVEHSTHAVLASTFENQALGGATGKPLHVDPEQWWTAMTQVVDDLHGVQLAIGGDIKTRAEHDRRVARETLALLTASAALTLLIALLLWISTIRSILRPLRQLTSEARTTARRRLPDAIAAVQDADDPLAAAALPRSALSDRHDEFATVAAALDDLQATSLRLAAGQAVLRRNTSDSLAHLARRNQNLVRRQLAYITALENKETDPDQLADLFELDHLATRMRRTAESLLILVGEHSPRRWPGVIDVTDVLRSAFADVEDYRRVVLRRTEEAGIRGTAAGEIAHLVAELLENALSFSPPDREVEVQARRADGGYHVAIVDSGLGMTPGQITEANERLRGEHAFLAAPTRQLGHFVVGRIAARLGIKVWLHESPLTGITARIVVPAELLADTPASAGIPDPTGADAVAQPPVEIPVSVGAVPKAIGASTPAAPTGEQIPSPPPHPFDAGPEKAAPLHTDTSWDGPVTIPSPTTKNGLVKRIPRDRGRTVPAAIAPSAPAVPQAPPAPIADRSPGEVRSMLNSFRSGVHGGQAADRR